MEAYMPDTIKPTIPNAAAALAIQFAAATGKDSIETIKRNRTKIESILNEAGGTVDLTKLMEEVKRYFEADHGQLSKQDQNTGFPFHVIYLRPLTAPCALTRERYGVATPRTGPR